MKLGLANRGQLAWSFGGGYRHYFPDLDVVAGVNSYFNNKLALVCSNGAFAQELLANTWEAPGNFYQPFASAPTLVDQRVDPNSVAFTDNNLTFTRIDSVAEL